MVTSAEETNLNLSHPSDPLSKVKIRGEKAESGEAAIAERPWKLRPKPAKSSRLKQAQRPRFSVSLSSEEIEEDIYTVTGSRPKRRPKKRPRHLQKQIDMVFPGSWLTEITVELYRVPDEQ